MNVTVDPHSNGQKARFERWLRDYRRLIFRVVMVYAPSPDSQEDLFQEIALALWRSIDKFEGRSSESTWIYRVAFNTAISHRRGVARRPVTKPIDAELSGRFDVERDAQLDWLYTQIRTMSRVERSLVLLYLDGNSYADMAAVLGISQSAVGVKINRMKKRLKKLLEKG